MSPAHIFAYWMASHSLGVWEQEGDGSPMFSPLLPDAPLNATSLASPSPIIDGREMRSGLSVIHPVVSVLVRNRDHKSAWELAQAIVDAAAETKNESVSVPPGSILIAAISRTSGPQDLGQETSSGAFVVSMTFSFSFG